MEEDESKPPPKKKRRLEEPKQFSVQLDAPPQHFMKKLVVGENLDFQNDEGKWENCVVQHIVQQHEETVVGLKPRGVASCTEMNLGASDISDRFAVAGEMSNRKATKMFVRTGWLVDLCNEKFRWCTAQVVCEDKPSGQVKCCYEMDGKKCHEWVHLNDARIYCFGHKVEYKLAQNWKKERFNSLVDLIKEKLGVKLADFDASDYAQQNKSFLDDIESSSVFHDSVQAVKLSEMCDVNICVEGVLTGQSEPVVMFDYGLDILCGDEFVQLFSSLRVTWFEQTACYYFEDLVKRSTDKRLLHYRKKIFD